MIRVERSTPPFFLVLFLLGLLTMFAASLHSVMSKLDIAKPGEPGVSVEATTPTKDVAAGSPEAQTDLVLSEDQADSLTGLMRQLQTNPNDADALIEIGESFLMAKDWKRAEVFLNRAILSRPSDIRPRYMLGVSLYQQDKIQDAAHVFEELLEIEDAPAAQYNLAIIYKYHLDKIKEAEALFKKIAAAPDVDPETLNRANKELSSAQE